MFLQIHCPNIIGWQARNLSAEPLLFIQGALALTHIELHHTFKDKRNTLDWRFRCEYLSWTLRYQPEAIQSDSLRHQLADRARFLDSRFTSYFETQVEDLADYWRSYLADRLRTLPRCLCGNKTLFRCACDFLLAEPHRRVRLPNPKLWEHPKCCGLRLEASPSHASCNRVTRSSVHSFLGFYQLDEKIDQDSHSAERIGDTAE
jgi:hypothetical protein